MEWFLRALPWLLLVTSVSGQSQCLSLTSKFPDCVAGCVTTGASSIGCTNTLDLSCQCNPDSSAAIQAYAAKCATSACKGDAGAILDGLEAGTSVCNCVTSAGSEALQLVTITDSYESSSTGKPPFGCGGGNSGDDFSPPPYSSSLSPASSSTQDSYAYESADAVTPAQSHGDDQDADCCEKTKVITVVHTTTTVSSWTPWAWSTSRSPLPYTPPAWSPSHSSSSWTPPAWSSPHSSSSWTPPVWSSPRSSSSWTPPAWSSPHRSSSWTFAQGPFETEDGSSPYDTQTPFKDDAENQPVTEEEGACISAELSTLPSCAHVCYGDVARAVSEGCAAYDYQCQRRNTCEPSFDYYFRDCLTTACTLSDYTAAEQFLSRACACVSTSSVEDDSHSSKREAPQVDGILARDAPQEPQPQDASPAWARHVDLAAENCTSLAQKAVPTCAQECYLSIASGVGCEALDFPCQCKEDTKAKLTTMMMPCVLTACDFAELPSVIAGGSSVCSCASATDKGQAWGQQKEAEAPAPTPAPGSEPEKMGGPTTTTCEVVVAPTQDCSVHRPTFAPCGKDCLSPVVPEAGCGIDDFQCQCAPDKQTALSTLVRPCVEESCQGTSAAVPIYWDPAAMCDCASGGRTSTTCYGTTATGPITSSSTPTTASTSTADDEETAGLQGAAGRCGVGIIVGIITAVFVAAMAL